MRPWRKRGIGRHEKRRRWSGGLQTGARCLPQASILARPGGRPSPAPALPVSPASSGKSGARQDGPGRAFRARPPGSSESTAPGRRACISRHTGYMHTMQVPIRRRRPAHWIPRPDQGHVIVFLPCCTHGRSRWLADSVVHRLLREAWLAASRWKVGRYVLMPDHLHLFCAPDQEAGRGLVRVVGLLESSREQGFGRRARHALATRILGWAIASA